MKLKIAICGSMAFARDMIKIRKDLVKLGHKSTIQKDIDIYAKGKLTEEDKWRKIRIDPFKTYFKEIKKCDAILVINKDKNNIKNYVGGNTLIEIAFAYILNKKIFLFNPVPRMNYSDEIEAMKPIILNGDLNKIQ